MNRRTQQALERYYFEQFRSQYPVPEGEIIFTDKPDVIIQGGRKIGVEIANLYIAPGSDPGSEQVQRRRRLEVLKLARQLHFGGGGRQIDLSVDFNPAYPIRDVHSVALALVNIAADAELLPTTQIKRAAFAHHPELRFVHYNARE